MVEDSDEEDLTDLVDGVNHIKSDGDIGVLCEDDTLLVFMDQLKILASRAVPACRSCKSHEVEIKDTYKGSAVYLEWVCKEGHSNGRWCSQPLLNRRVHSGDFLISATTVLSGNNFSKLKLWADMLKLKFPSEQQFFRVQGAYLVPTVDSYWQEHQQDLIQSFHGQDVIVLGDGCNDSPGHCAQYCSYTLMENDSKKILTLKTMDKRETDRKSAAMEKKALKACLEELLDKDVCVKELVTDGHLGITAMMSTDNKEQKGIFHSHDIWHVAKNLGKKLTKLSLKKDNRILRDWIKDIVNHFWYACKVAETEAQFKGIWVSVLHHVTDEHEWLISYGDDGCNECHHGPLAAEDRDKPWLHRIKNSAVLKDLSSVVMDKRLLKKVAYYLKFRSTAELEGFHQHLLMYCAKRFAYTPPVYRMRNLLAALNHNLHQDRSVQFNKNGSMRLRRVFNKKSGRWSVYPVKEQKKNQYIRTMLKRALRLRLDDRVGMSQKRVLKEGDPRRISKNLAPLSPKATKEIVLEQKSRFK
ncbi:uncharacterized protein LOC128246652 [Mya arenaria]|uniref:uncharacterized protein LOC128246652 n=1 Tax=Mya arenaria TaxID=6604 RepID=UPI0022E0F203|nr:uncharacterized protein LOC128246652 [Mya arenaria]XP_052820914.1 uncharacterized protein LOC128246652 [Mya arenaria]XP_052820915.1 uncharacterized protein LOC128246652 [Mya arenaria]XP_052820916.1 uncharacterized protein LOC128246652 [Mya arenaria]